MPEHKCRLYPRIPSTQIRAAAPRLAELISNKKEICEISSFRGLYEFVDGKTYSINWADKPTELIRIEETSFVVDRSTVAREQAFQFPRSHVAREIIRTTYKISRKSTVQFIIESGDESMDYYFMTNDYDQSIHQMDIIAFLKMLK
jgi:hypothetical protein